MEQLIPAFGGKLSSALEGSENESESSRTSLLYMLPPSNFLTRARIWSCNTYCHDSNFPGRSLSSIGDKLQTLPELIHQDYSDLKTRSSKFNAFTLRNICTDKDFNICFLENIYQNYHMLEHAASRRKFFQIPEEFPISIETGSLMSLIIFIIFRCIAMILRKWKTSMPSSQLNKEMTSLVSSEYSKCMTEKFEEVEENELLLSFPTIYQKAGEVSVFPMNNPLYRTSDQLEIQDNGEDECDSIDSFSFSSIYRTAGNVSVSSVNNPLYLPLRPQEEEKHLRIDDKSDSLSFFSIYKAAGKTSVSAMDNPLCSQNPLEKKQVHLTTFLRNTETNTPTAYSSPVSSVVSDLTWEGDQQSPLSPDSLQVRVPLELMSPLTFVSECESEHNNLELSDQEDFQLQGILIATEKVSNERESISVKNIQDYADANSLTLSSVGEDRVEGTEEENTDADSQDSEESDLIFLSPSKSIKNRHKAQQVSSPRFTSDPSEEITLPLHSHSGELLLISMENTAVRAFRSQYDGMKKISILQERYSFHLPQHIEKKDMTSPNAIDRSFCLKEIGSPSPKKIRN